MPVLIGDWISRCKYDVICEEWVLCPIRNKQIIKHRFVLYNITGDKDDCLNWVKYKEKTMESSSSEVRYVLVYNDLFRPTDEYPSLFNPRSKEMITKIMIDNKVIEVHTLI